MVRVRILFVLVILSLSFNFLKAKRERLSKKKLEYDDKKDLYQLFFKTLNYLNREHLSVLDKLINLGVLSIDIREPIEILRQIPDNQLFPFPKDVFIPTKVLNSISWIRETMNKQEMQIILKLFKHASLANTVLGTIDGLKEIDNNQFDLISYQLQLKPSVTNVIDLVINFKEFTHYQKEKLNSLVLLKMLPEFVSKKLNVLEGISQKDIKAIIKDFNLKEIFINKSKYSTILTVITSTSLSTFKLDDETSALSTVDLTTNLQESTTTSSVFFTEPLTESKSSKFILQKGNSVKDNSNLQNETRIDEFLSYNSSISNKASDSVNGLSFEPEISSTKSVNPNIQESVYKKDTEFSFSQSNFSTTENFINSENHTQSIKDSIENSTNHELIYTENSTTQSIFTDLYAEISKNTPQKLRLDLTTSQAESSSDNVEMINKSLLNENIFFTESTDLIKSTTMNTIEKANFDLLFTIPTDSSARRSTSEKENKEFFTEDLNRKSDITSLGTESMQLSKVPSSELNTEIKISDILTFPSIPLNKISISDADIQLHQNQSEIKNSFFDDSSIQQNSSGNFVYNKSAINIDINSKEDRVDISAFNKSNLADPINDFNQKTTATTTYTEINTDLITSINSTFEDAQFSKKLEGLIGEQNIKTTLASTDTSAKIMNFTLDVNSEASREPKSNSYQTSKLDLETFTNEVIGSTETYLERKTGTNPIKLIEVIIENTTNLPNLIKK
ncbi:unnamed protein product [Brachionus calyciflorus]|uniref:Uncharacterized protein n=1 Tax=Brachionus calyciflorus TaxID=104777 RepID=A0A813TLZ2_9BILA|nr:unnamed protein product [Brachionus calyciflorus]